MTSLRNSKYLFIFFSFILNFKIYIFCQSGDIDNLIFVTSQFWRKIRFLFYFSQKNKNFKISHRYLETRTYPTPFKHKNKILPQCFGVQKLRLIWTGRNSLEMPWESDTTKWFQKLLQNVRVVQSSTACAIVQRRMASYLCVIMRWETYNGEADG